VGYTGLRGRPKKIVDLEFLKEAISNSRNISCAELARSLGIHRNTLRLYMQHHGIEQKYTPIGDSDLDNLVTACKKKHPDSGIRYIMGFMRAHGIRVQYCRVTQSIHRVDCLGQVLRDCHVKTRRKYHVKRPNTLWHMDGHHKLIRWGIVIHGFIDGFCCTVHSILLLNNR